MKIPLKLISCIFLFSIAFLLSFIPLVTPKASEIKTAPASNITAFSKIVDADEAASLGLSSDYVGFYAISSKDDLLLFSEIVSTKTDANAVLLCDITLNENLISEKITVNPETYEPTAQDEDGICNWTPIPEFSGTIDGDGHTIYGLYIDSSSACTGLVSVLSESGVIKNLTISSSYIYSEADCTGAFAGINHGTLISLKNEAMIVSTGNYLGGIAGKNTGLIKACNQNNNVIGKDYVGGVCGQNSGTVSHSFVHFTSAFNDFYILGSHHIGGICGLSDGTLQYSYFASENSDVFNDNTDAFAIVGKVENGSQILSCYALLDNVSSDKRNGTYTTKAQLLSGEICYLLNAEETHFYQTVGEEHPSHSGLTVYQNCTYDCPDSHPRDITYSNAPGYTVIHPEHYYISDCDEFCEYCNFHRETSILHTFVYNCVTFCKKCGQEIILSHAYDNDCDEECNICHEKREVEHKYDSECDRFCNDCGREREVTTDHTYTDCCDDTCNLCSEARTPPHSFDSDCDTDCNNCDFMRDASSTPHTYIHPCDTACTSCGASREMIEHTYETPCVSKCLYCDATRTPPHQYTSDCDHACDLCGHIRETDTNHTYSSPCDDTCDLCGEARIAPHEYSSDCDHICDLCGHIRETETGHTYTDFCDDTCDLCGETRTAPHEYSSDCDHICDLCEHTRETKSIHTYSSPCDDTCDLCNETRTAPHKYTSDCDTDCDLCTHHREALTDHSYNLPCDSKCKACGHERDGAEHTYSEGCNGTCIYCDSPRENPTHIYDNDCDNSCNLCGYERETSEHNFGEYRTALKATIFKGGVEMRECKICGKVDIKNTDPLIYSPLYYIPFSLLGIGALTGLFFLIKFIIKKIYWL